MTASSSIIQCVKMPCCQRLGAFDRLEGDAQNCAESTPILKRVGI